MRPRPTCVFAVNMLLRLCVPCLTLFLDKHRPPCVLPPLVQGIPSPPLSERPLPPGLPSLFAPLAWPSRRSLAWPSRRSSLLCAALSNATITATNPAPSLPEFFIALAFVGAQLGTLNLRCSCRVVLLSKWAIISTAVFARAFMAPTLSHGTLALGRCSEALLRVGLHVVYRASALVLD